MTKYTIYTKWSNVKNICCIVAEHFGVFNFTKTLRQGRYKTMVIDIIVLDSPHVRKSMRLLCQKIKGLQRENAIGFTKREFDYEVVE